MGGANSHDISGGILDPFAPDYKEKYKECMKNPFCLFRVNHRSWWEEEVPSSKEKINALNNIERYDKIVNFVLTHEAPASIVKLLDKYLQPEEYSFFLEDLRTCIDYDYWLFGYYHINRAINAKDICFYEKIMQIV